MIRLLNPPPFTTPSIDWPSRFCLIRDWDTVQFQIHHGDIGRGDNFADRVQWTKNATVNVTIWYNSHGSYLRDRCAERMISIIDALPLDRVQDIAIICRLQFCNLDSNCWKHIFNRCPAALQVQTDSCAESLVAALTPLKVAATSKKRGRRIRQPKSQATSAMPLPSLRSLHLSSINSSTRIRRIHCINCTYQT